MNKRQIVSTYYRNHHVTKVTRAAYPNNAVANAVTHMVTNDYGATHVEVFSLITGKLYVILRNQLRDGKLKMFVDFKDDVIGRIE